MEKRYVLFILFTIFLSSSVLAAQYSYNQKVPISGNGNELGYVKPYRMNVLGTYYSYLEWQRYGYPVGYSFPIALIKGTTTALPFGINGELLRIKIGEITSSSVDLTIDQSDITTELNNLDKTLPENIEAINKDVQKKAEPVIKEINNNLNKLNNDISLRANKFASRTYHSSLHVIDLSNSKLKEVSNSIKNKESELAEKIADSVVATVSNVFLAGSGVSYKVFISQVPASFRHDVTAFIYNIEDSQDNVDETSLADKGIATLYIGNPNVNKISLQFNNQLKAKGLPYFEGNKIVGKRNYSSADIGMITAIPEETSWTQDTLKSRWDNDRIRLYKTLIAGVGDSGLEASALWYNKQLDLAKTSISNAINLAGGTIENGDIEPNEILSSISTTVMNDPKASIGFGAIAQGWILAGISSLQSPDFTKIDSLGYVVIVKKEGNSYRTLETWSLIGDKKSYFLDEYQEVINQVENVVNNVQNIQNNIQSSSPLTGKVVNENNQQSPQEVKKANPIVSFFKNLWGKLFK
ncbi:MAG: hypothetical protein NT076_04295 [Candidatus Pacearchaeota archaeon]|nr:hypothetical protein [Candidatus Pacearchaeota archaeon]